MLWFDLFLYEQSKSIDFVVGICITSNNPQDDNSDCVHQMDI